jgi:hypothetical protein
MVIGIHSRDNDLVDDQSDQRQTDQRAASGALLMKRWPWCRPIQMTGFADLIEFIDDDEFSQKSRPRIFVFASVSCWNAEPAERGILSEAAANITAWQHLK